MLLCGANNRACNIFLKNAAHNKRCFDITDAALVPPRSELASRCCRFDDLRFANHAVEGNTSIHPAQVKTKQKAKREQFVINLVDLCPSGMHAIRDPMAPMISYLLQQN